MENEGLQRLDIGAIEYQWRQVLPLDDQFRSVLDTNGAIPVWEKDPSVIGWPMLDQRTLTPSTTWVEAGERQAFDIDQLVPATSRTIEFTSFVGNPSVEQMGWFQRSLYSIEGGCESA